MGHFFDGKTKVVAGGLNKKIPNKKIKIKKERKKRHRQRPGQGGRSEVGPEQAGKGSRKKSAKTAGGIKMNSGAQSDPSRYRLRRIMKAAEPY
jgi:hypothetical protein